MKEQQKESKFSGLKPGRRQLVSLAGESYVTTGQLEGGGALPLVVKPRVEGVDLPKWSAGNRAFIEKRLAQHGAILFRGFGLHTPEDFERFVRAGVGDPIKYEERSSPRHEVTGHIYTSTDYPPPRDIFPHNEHSYNLTFPLRLLFFCETPAGGGGETPIADTRKIFRRLSPRVREAFARRGYMYVRNFGDGLGVPWQAAFQTADKSVVEDYCLRNDIRWQWKEGDRLRTQQVRRAFAAHPRTGEPVWFNHATFFHVTTLEPAIRDGLLAQFDEEDLPNNTYYGDGLPFEPEVLDELREAYRQEVVKFPWQRGDVLLLDNMLTSHGRCSYSGPRSILVAMAEPFGWAELPAPADAA
jgi:alpha-ketoglutarate-dependent taurine dioxygenase